MPKPKKKQCTDYVRVPKEDMLRWYGVIQKNLSGGRYLVQCAKEDQPLKVVNCQLRGAMRQKNLALNSPVLIGFREYESVKNKADILVEFKNSVSELRSLSPCWGALYGTDLVFDEAAEAAEVEFANI